NIGIGLVYGGAQYRGDLVEDGQNPYENLKPLYGLSISYQSTPSLTFFSSFIHTELSSSDSYSKDLDRKSRNLHFRSNLNEYCFGFEFYPLQLFTKRKLKYQIFYKTGVAVFNFNPQAEYLGTWYDLQPLHTEGQGMPNSGIKPYLLVDVAYPFGGGFKIDVSKYLSIKYELSPRKTFNDYIDDVSGSYFDLDMIRNYSSDIAAKLSYRITDWDLEDAPPIVNGKQRGNKNNKDWYIINAITIQYNFGKESKKSNADMNNMDVIKLPQSDIIKI
ncbi:MAG: hypothetical protein RLZZ546_3037, partial [Bacteroidota bacterium]